ncbi:MAG TPA: hypothetical protein VKV19_12545 [Ktedonobacteraceae bacterium]|jgi:hypothetical protein|nr:hypothetical protein [Ktedonobacteraceae bacterium]
MSDELDKPLQVDLLAASLRADTTDLKAFMEALAVKLEGAMPDQTVVTRQNKLFSREHPVREILITLGEYQYRISHEQRGPLLTQRAKVVRGIVLKTEQLPMDQWIEELAEGLAQQAAQSFQARSALERFLL